MTITEISLVLAKKLMVTKPAFGCFLVPYRLVLAKKLMVTKPFT